MSDSNYIKYEVEPGTTISEEHGWLCIRNHTGWLLWSVKIVEMPARGLSLCTVLSDMLNGSMPTNPRPEAAPVKVAA